MWVITNIEQKIYDKLISSNLFVWVYKYFIVKNDWFPYVSFELQDFMWDKLDTCSNERKWIFKLVIFQEMSNRTREQAKTSLYNITEKIIDLFDKDELLWWEVTKTEVLAWWIWQYENNKWWKSLFIEINIEFTTILQIK